MYLAREKVRKMTCSSHTWNTLFILISLTQIGVQRVISGNNDDTTRDFQEILSNNSLIIEGGIKNQQQDTLINIRQFDNSQQCNPPASAGLAQFIIGYGSLMQTESKDRTYPKTGENIPVRIHGYSRLWNCKGTSISFSTTYLGAAEAKGKSFVAAVYKLPSAAGLTDYDTRESFYCREEVPMSKIQLLTDKKKLALGQYWIYVTKPEFSEEPSREYPMVQSYVDTFLSGCFELEEKFSIENFAKDCVSTTEGWDSPWVNDRIFPRRPFMHQPMAGKIDKLLNEMVPKAYRNIRIE